MFTIFLKLWFMCWLAWKLSRISAVACQQSWPSCCLPVGQKGWVECVRVWHAHGTVGTHVSRFYVMYNKLFCNHYFKKLLVFSQGIPKHTQFKRFMHVQIQGMTGQVHVLLPSQWYHFGWEIHFFWSDISLMLSCSSCMYIEQETPRGQLNAG